MARERFVVGAAAGLDVQTGTEALRRLALDLLCCWNHTTDDILCACRDTR
jgi:hypothetical protein